MITAVRESLGLGSLLPLDRSRPGRADVQRTPVSTRYQAGVTFSACGPLGPWVMSKLTS